MLLAFDNTDGPAGGCTTHVAFHVLLALPEVALAGMPRLVRLNPNIPWKTRGNGAVVLPLVLPRGPAARVGELRGLHVQAFPEGEPIPDDQMVSVVDRAWKAIQAVAQPDAKPAVAAFQRPPPPAAYWQAVRTLVDAGEARDVLDRVGAPWRSHADHAALPGVLGAAAWPGPPSSFEVLAYREPKRWATERAIAAAPLRALDMLGDTFHTYDATAGPQGRLTCVPHTPDPVLLGLRGRDPERLVATAHRVLPHAAQEPIDAWLVWATNQASGDHVTPVADLASAAAYATVALEATVTALPVARRGGHVFVGLADASGGRFDAVAFEPTKAFRDLVRALRPGDRVVAVGGLTGNGDILRSPHAHPAAQTGAAPVPLVKLEKLRFIELAPQFERAPPPRCPVCGRTMKSAGASQGYRCRTCSTKAPKPEAAVEVPRTAALGWHEVPVIARRHLHRPLAFGSDAS